MQEYLQGLGLITVSAALNAAFAVPFKFRRNYEWENTWLLTMLCAMIIFPLCLAPYLVPQWLSAITGTDISTVLIVVFCGFLWGTGSVTFAIGLDKIGISLGYAIIMGVVTVVGSTIPIVRKWSEIPPAARLVILLGILVCILGVAICGRAGMLREKGSKSNFGVQGNLSARENTVAHTFTLGLIWCVVAGILSAGNNLGFDFADRIAQQAQSLNAPAAFVSLTRWIPVYWGGYFAVFLFCGAKAVKAGTWSKYKEAGTAHDAGLAVLMGGLHFLSQLAYGIGAFYVGHLGTAVGFAIMVAGSLMIANLFGFIVGEWKAAPRSSIIVLYLGLATLVLAVAILSYGNSIFTAAS